MRIIRVIRRFSWSLLIVSAFAAGAAGMDEASLVKIEGVQARGEGDSLMVLIELSRPVEVRDFTLTDPPRIVLDFPGTVTTGKMQILSVSDGTLRAVRWAQMSIEPLIARVVLDVDYAAGEIPKYHILSKGNRVAIVCDGGMSRSCEDPALGGVEEDRDRITMTFKDADIESVLRLLSENYGLNIISDGKLDRTVTTKLEGVTIDEALSAIVRANGYNYVRQGDIIIVKEDLGGKKDMVTRVFKLDYIDADAFRQACSRLVSKEGSIESFSRHLLEKPEGVLWNEKIFRDRKDILLVTDYPDVISVIESMVEELDAPVPQVMIEVKFIERTLSESDDLGINWNIDAEFSGEPPIDPQLLSQFGGTGEIYIPNKVFKEGDFTFGQLKLDRFSAILQLIEQSGKAKLLSNPKIVTLDNHEARITVGTKILIPIRERGTASDVILESFEEMDIGISLSVIPHVHRNGDVTLQIQPRVEEITGYTGEFLDRPIIAERTATTQIKVKDGETIAIGGLIRESDVETVRRVPVLGRIPLIKYLFTHKSKRMEKTDLLIFITPELMTGDRG